MTGNKLAPSSWQKSPSTGPILVASDNRSTVAPPLQPMSLVGHQAEL